MGDLPHLAVIPAFGDLREADPDVAIAEERSVHAGLDRCGHRQSFENRLVG